MVIVATCIWVWVFNGEGGGGGGGGVLGNKIHMSNPYPISWGGGGGGGRGVLNNDGCVLHVYL